VTVAYIARMASVAERLQEALDSAGWSQGKLARTIGVTQGAVSQILLGKTLRSKFLPEMAEVLGVSLRWLTGEDVPRDPLTPPPPRVAPSPPQVVMMGVTMPPERALVRMFEALLAGIDPDASRDELALLLGQRLPIGLSQLRDLLPDSVSVPPRRERVDVDEALATPHPEPTQ
jgi:transcriptional regulator with XRE-family HTH domain